MRAIVRAIPVKTLSRIHPKFATPYVAIIAIAGIDFLPATFGGFEQLAIFSNATILLVYFGMAVAVLSNLLRKEMLGIVVVIALLSLIYFIFVKRVKAKNPHF